MEYGVSSAMLWKIKGIEKSEQGERQQQGISHRSLFYIHSGHAEDQCQ
jgi:hypothetical protein